MVMTMALHVVAAAIEDPIRVDQASAIMVHTKAEVHEKAAQASTAQAREDQASAITGHEKAEAHEKAVPGSMVAQRKASPARRAHRREITGTATVAEMDPRTANRIARVSLA